MPESDHPRSNARRQGAQGHGNLRVGELAQRVGVSVRTLHHYDDIGLLRSRRTGSGHRFYQPEDLVRLQQVVSLRQLGLPLDRIREALDAQEPSDLAKTLRQHHAALSDRIEQQVKARDALARLIADVDALEPGQDADFLPLDHLLTSLEITMNLDDYYTKDQQAQLAARRQSITPERMCEVEQEWRDLIAAVRAEMERGTDPTTEPVLGHARQWRGLIDEFTGADPGIEASLQKLNREQPQELESRGFQLDGEVMAYIGRAMAALQ